jgi:hypothetical protein
MASKLEYKQHVNSWCTNTTIQNANCTDKWKVHYEKIETEHLVENQTKVHFIMSGYIVNKQ